MFSSVKNPHCQIEVGKKTFVGENIVLGPRCKKIKIGYGCFLGRDIYIDVDELEIGDYSTIHHGSILHGVSTMIGHNCWIGHYSIIDSLGGNTRIGNNVGVGAHSQLWSHMKFGDVLAGCNWNSSGPLLVEDDVWFVGHSIVAPIHAKARSMLMTGSVATKNMEENCIYSGTPAKDMSDKFGYQFAPRTDEEIEAGFEKLRREFNSLTGINVDRFISVQKFSGSKDVTEFCLRERRYVPRRTDDEYSFIKYMLYDKAKFIPIINQEK